MDTHAAATATPSAPAPTLKCSKKRGKDKDGRETGKRRKQGDREKKQKKTGTKKTKPRHGKNPRTRRS
jgi:hypothetical protein